MATNLEEIVQEIFPDTNVPITQYRSFVNQPERIQISSQEDVQDYDPTTLTSYFNFRVLLPRPALDVKSIQLARASIPTPVASLPDTECTFWYYGLPPVAQGGIYQDDNGNPGTLEYIFSGDGNVYFESTGDLVENSDLNFGFGVLMIEGVLYTYDPEVAWNTGTGNTYVPVYDDTNTLTFFIIYIGSSIQLANPAKKYLHYIRLLPSTTQPDLLFNGGNPDNVTFGFNKIFEDYPALLVELNNATLNDPLEATPMNEDPFDFTWIEEDVSFILSQRFNRIYFVGKNEFYTYLPAASDDPLWFEAAQDLQQRDIQNLNNQTTFFPPGAIAVIQPYVPFRNLNLRLGFTYATYPSGVNYLSMLRPYPNPDEAGDFDHLAPGYPDLVNTSCVHLYCDVTGGSTVDSIANKALLATIPVNVPPLLVVHHSLPLANPLTKISNQIYEIYIEMRTDTGQPYYIGNNAIVSLEFILTY